MTYENEAEAKIKSGKKLAKISWILLGVSCLLSIIPGIGILVWLFSAPVLLATIIMSILCMTKGLTGQGIGVLLCSLIFAPLFMGVASCSSTIAAAAAADAAGKSKHQSTDSHETTTTPVASEPAKSNGYVIGDNVRFVDSVWMVDSAQDLGHHLKSVLGEKYTEGKFILVKYRVKNTTDEEEQIFEAPKLSDSRGRKFNTLDDASFYRSEGEKGMMMSQLTSGVVKSFSEIYEVPENAKDIVFEARALGFNPEVKKIRLDF